MLSLAAAVLAGTAVGTTPPAIDWVKGYTFGNAESHPHAGVETADGGFLVVGDGVDYGNTTPVNRHIFVLRTSSDGTPLWQRSIGDVGYNYGKFGIELPSDSSSPGNVLVAGALSQRDSRGRAVLHRALFLLDGATGNTIQQMVFPNNGAALGKRDGFMCVAMGEDPNTVILTGFVGGENSSTGYVDEPMFLIGGGKPCITKVSLLNGGSVVYDKLLDGPSQGGFASVQGMRLFYSPTDGGVYFLSHTVTYDQGGNFQMGLSSLRLDGSVRFMKAFPAEHDSDYHGHASHPYALAAGNNENGELVVGLGGLAVLTTRGVDQCQGRLITMSSSGDMIFDHRFTSEQKDTNIECYGLQQTADRGWVLSCGTGVEPELHPKDSQKLKTWMALAHRVDENANVLWSKTYTTNENLQNNAGEFVIALREGAIALYIDAQTWGSPSTGGNFAIMRLVSQ